MRCTTGYLCGFRAEPHQYRAHTLTNRWGSICAATPLYSSISRTTARDEATCYTPKRKPLTSWIALGFLALVCLASGGRRLHHPSQVEHKVRAPLLARHRQCSRHHLRSDDRALFRPALSCTLRRIQTRMRRQDADLPDQRHQPVSANYCRPVSVALTDRFVLQMDQAHYVSNPFSALPRML